MMKEAIAHLAMIVSETVWRLFTVILVLKYIYPDIWKFINGG